MPKCASGGVSAFWTEMSVQQTKLYLSIAVKTRHIRVNSVKEFDYRG